MKDKLEEQAQRFEEYRKSMEIAIQRRDDKLDVILQHMQEADQHNRDSLIQLQADHNIFMARLGMHH